MDPVESFYEGIDPRFVTNIPEPKPPTEPEKQTNGHFLDNLVGLIINYLPAQMTEDDLRALFNTVCPMHSCRLMTDKATGRSLSYGFVNYKTIPEAQSAIEALNGYQIDNKTIRVSFAREINNEAQPVNLYVQNLSPLCGEEQLRVLFEPFGEILSLKVLMDPQGQSKCSGMIRFSTRSCAEAAINALNGKQGQEDKPLMVKYARPPAPRPVMFSQPQSMYNHYYSSLSHNHMAHQNPSISSSFNPEQFYTPYPMQTSQYPHVQANQSYSMQPNQQSYPSQINTNYQPPIPTNPSYQPKISTNQQAYQPQIPTNQQSYQTQIPTNQQSYQPQIPTNQPPSNQPAYPIIQSNPYSQHINTMPINPNPDSTVQSTACVYVSNLAPESTILHLFQLFAPFGALTHVNVLPANTKSGHSSAIGFVNFVKINEAYNAINSLNRSQTGAAPGKGLNVCFKQPMVTRHK